MAKTVLHHWATTQITRWFKDFSRRSKSKSQELKVCKHELLSLKPSSTKKKKKKELKVAVAGIRVRIFIRRKAQSGTQSPQESYGIPGLKQNLLEFEARPKDPYGVSPSLCWHNLHVIFRKGAGLPFQLPVFLRQQRNRRTAIQEDRFGRESGLRSCSGSCSLLINRRCWVPPW
jgi:hypothetical protein